MSPASPAGPPGAPEASGSTPLQALCQVSLAQVSDVDKAVAAAKDAFENGLWGKISARDRGRLLYRCEPHPMPVPQAQGRFWEDLRLHSWWPQGGLSHVTPPPGEARCQQKPREDLGCSHSWLLSQTGAGGCLPGGPWGASKLGADWGAGACRWLEQ